ncbi:MAG: glucosaminidase domain-containing protein [Chitinophagaceae bacterium]|nr:glucosaminidase domain-containing protein [Chitinophagaceae bacterium]
MKLFFILTLWSKSQDTDKIQLYIDKYRHLAIAEMKRTGVPAAIKLAQGIHETSAGTSELVKRSNNHFGIKCKSDWTGEKVKHNDDAPGECFRKYASAEESYRDHSDFLKNNNRYAFLFQLNPLDYKEWARGLKKAGYATNPRYADILIKTIEDYNLQYYTLLALGKTNEEFQSTAQLNSTTRNASAFDSSYTEQPRYPSGEFKINDTRVVFVPKGTSYLSVAQQYNVDLFRLFEFNEIPYAEFAEKDQLIYLQRKRKTGKDEYHIVQPGETLHDIAQKQGIRLESLKELNWLNEGENPAVGEKLHLKKKSEKMPRLALKGIPSLVPEAPTGSHK